MEQEKLDSLPSLVKSIRELLPQEAGIAVADSSHFIYYEPGKSVNLPIKPGESLRRGSVSWKALKTKRKVSMLVSRDVFGVPYFATGYPILNNGQIEGIVTVVFPPKSNQESLPAQSPTFLVGKREDRWFTVDYDQIVYIKSEKGKTLIITEYGTFMNKHTLNDLEYILPEHQFFRTHRSFIVNLNWIKEIHPHFHSTFSLILKDEHQSRVPVSQKYSSLFRHFLGF
ncbi:LytTR family transcriptional regulator [Melghiribacillus thermohalophilus]|uniref:LytTR family transcriptional regulator n=1 Tax=Melghiribacillus thermohalophilus TaxID=1324956 RepID=A0A4R3MU69_9BACI|nr:LytTR family DNA-binding domain-containing protein [Melghiribacillus thermohalophilus]TCT20008.1 LytTR family transcriptional regulator [Melghiribacillus thermohalophilus]